LVSLRSVFLSVLLLVEFDSVILCLQCSAIQILGIGVAFSVAVTLSKWLPLIQSCISLMDFFSFEPKSVVALLFVFKIDQR